jgi:hypothetical protein
MRGVSKSSWSDPMKKENDAAQLPYGYLLPEEHHQYLEQLCEHLLLMAEFVTATTEEEDDEPLRIRRSRLGWMFESVACQLKQVLVSVKWVGRGVQVSQRKH